MPSWCKSKVKMEEQVFECELRKGHKGMHKHTVTITRSWNDNRSLENEVRE